MISAVVPAFNEEESLEAFYKVLIPNLSKLDKEYEVIFVDDGSTDKTLEILKKFEKENENVKILSFRKNRGKAEVLTSGFKEAKGDLIVTLDADLQDRPEEIGKLIDKQKEGYDLVSGWRKKRKDSKLLINLPSKLFNFLAGRFWGLKLQDYNCGLKVYSREAARSLNLYGGMQRFIPLLLYQSGFKVVEVEVIHERRMYGKSKYGFSKSFKEFPDMFTMLFLTKYAKRPLHFFGTVGVMLGAIGFLILLYLSILHFMGEAIGTRPLLVFGILLVLAGFQLLFTGFLADLILHISEKNNNNSGPEDGLRYKSS